MHRITRHPPRGSASRPRLHAVGAPRAAVVALLVATLASARGARAGVVPRHEHVIVVVMENKSYAEVRYEPYTASLVAHGAEFTNSHAVTHPSQPNYLALWAADDLDVHDNTCPAPGSPFLAENLGHACAAAVRLHISGKTMSIV